MRKHSHLSCGTVVAALEPGLPVLLIRVQRHSGTFWGLPKGHVDNGETLAQAALRETAEETGLERSSLRLICYLGNVYYEFVSHEEEKTLNEKEVHFFLASVEHSETETNPPVEDEGILEARWFPLDEAMQTVSYDSYRRILEAARKSLLHQPPNGK
jgi:8-oxo-dGTP pyrophosphatase MutT (NUDIX family)